MDVVLKVLAGAKKGAKVAVKKEQFLIGRSQECHLCVGSSSVSRKHCAISRTDTTVTIKDLKSSNGTLVNGKRITEELELKSGDELEVGPLQFMVTISPGISNRKRSKVETVADAVDRAAETVQEDVGEEDISNWLLGPVPGSTTAAETQTIQMDDTNAIQARLAEEQARVDQSEKEALEEETSAEPAEEEKPKGPGKLPPIPSNSQAKNSGEAAEEALRSWNRRR